MPEYQFANGEGIIVAEDYDRNMYFSSEQVMQSLEEAFRLFPYTVEINQVEDFEDVFHVTYLDNDDEIKDIYICGKGTTPGGRSGLKDEQRIQPKAKYLNYVYDKKVEGKKGVFLGVYFRDGQTVFCTWKVTQSNAANSDTPISKQIKINSIAKAMREGFVQQDKGRGEYACAFKPAFLFFYLKNSEWLHTGAVNELADHTPPERNDDLSDVLQKDVFNTELQSKYPLNRILFGAPGTGKSYTLNKERKELLGDGNEYDYERVTFHPDYSYANFVGTYKPVSITNDEGKEMITYKYVPGPFMRLYVKALKNAQSHDAKPFLLIIEEINRANVAAVFGDIFQLLDRGDDGVSEYPIQASEDIKKYLCSELGGKPEDYEKIRIPDNMFIWATMNSADQGVFPMDTAFKRRWDFTYLGVNDSDEQIRGKYVYLAADKSQKVEWNKLRKAINNFLAKQKINEDKQLGPYFISKNIVVPENGDEIDRDKFIRVFKNKVIMYLFEDAAKQKRPSLFEGCSQNSGRYSEICRAFEAKGIKVFNTDIQNEFELEDMTSRSESNE